MLGGFDTISSLLKTDYPTISIVNGTGEVIKSGYPKTTPDHIAILGSLVSGPSASVQFRTVVGKPVDGVGIRWIITGTDGELEVTTPYGIPWTMTFAGSALKARLGKGSEVQVVDFERIGERDEVTGSQPASVNTARLYEAFADGRTERFCDFEEAVRVQKELDRIRNAAGAEWRL